jgi:hypothetical protein
MIEQNDWVRRHISVVIEYHYDSDRATPIKHSINDDDHDGI